MRKALAAGAGAVAAVAASASPASAHGIGGRLDLPVPRWLFVYGAVAALVVSFVALAALWREPRLEPPSDRAGRDGPLQVLLRSRAVEWTVRGTALLFFLVVLGSALAGSPDAFDNISVVAVYVWLWVGLAFAHALLGDVWATLSPFDTLARLLDLGREPKLPYPPAWGVWPATMGLLAFVWMELVQPFGTTPRSLGIAIVGYTAVTLAGMAVYGRERWNHSGETFAVYFGLLARIAPLARDDAGRVVLRPPLAGLPSLRPRPGLLTFVLVLLGSTTFDGFSRSPLWTDLVAGRSRGAAIALGTAGLLAVIAAVGVAYAAAMVVAARIVDGRWHPTAVRFAHSLVPIAFAYVVAHYFSLLVIEGQLGIRLLSDPFGSGMDVFGTADRVVNLAVVSAAAIWYVQVAAIVLGHIGGVVLAHDRAIAAFTPGRAIRTQYALLAVMVLYTATGLLILSG